MRVMRVTVNLAVPFAAVLFGLLLIPGFARAQSSSNCPTEPTSTHIAPGEVFAGTNCNLYSDGDVDSFTFTGTSGDTYQLATALSGTAVTNICLTLYSPTFGVIYGPKCTNAFDGAFSYYSVVTDQKLTTTGTYTIDITEESPGSSTPQNYGVSLEQLYPFPSYATQVPKLGESLAGDITPLTDANLFTFTSAPTGEYAVTATLTSNPSQNICLTVYNPDGTIPQNGSGCTNAFDGAFSYYSVAVDFTPDETDPSMAFVSVDGNDGTQTYNLEVSCLVGNCPPPIKTYPPCTLTDALSYNATSSTLTMNFTIGTNVAATWNAWLTYQNTIMAVPGYPIPQPITKPPVPITKTYTGLSVEGNVGVLSTLTTPTKGITCSSWERINTGTAP